MKPAEVLDCLDRKALVRLVRLRGLSTSNSNDDRKATLARSYRGDVEALINDLSRGELLEVFLSFNWFEVRGRRLWLRNPSQYRHDELRAFAIRAFAERPVRIVADFEEYEDEEEDEDEDDAEYAEDEGEEDEEDDGDEDDDASDDETEEEPRFIRKLKPEWSRPRKVARIMRRLGLGTPERLRTPRFQELIAALEQYGVVACLADDHAYEVLTNQAESPGIYAKLRLRKISSADSESGSKPTIGHERSKVVDTGPQIIVQSGERPVAQRAPRPPDYSLAVLRLKFLTAVPSVERRTMTEWPDGYLRAATKNLSLRPQETSLLRALSAGLYIGNHSPYEVIPQLTQVLTPLEWNELLDDFAVLNPFQPEFVQAITEQIQPIRTPRTSTDTWREATPTPPDLIVDEPDTDKHAMPMAAAAKGAETTETNVRDLGALAGMFEDE
ncbi:MAG: hypothetical protein AB7T06_37705 [Kofleriaceae bacterium]